MASGRKRRLLSTPSISGSRKSRPRRFLRQRRLQGQAHHLGWSYRTPFDHARCSGCDSQRGVTNTVATKAGRARTDCRRPPRVLFRGLFCGSAASAMLCQPGRPVAAAPLPQGFAPTRAERGLEALLFVGALQARCFASRRGLSRLRRSHKALLPQEPSEASKLRCLWERRKRDALPVGKTCRGCAAPTKKAGFLQEQFHKWVDCFCGNAASATKGEPMCSALRGCAAATKKPSKVSRRCFRRVVRYNAGTTPRYLAGTGFTCPQALQVRASADP